MLFFTSNTSRNYKMLFTFKLNRKINLLIQFVDRSEHEYWTYYVNIVKSTTIPEKEIRRWLNISDVIKYYKIDIYKFKSFQTAKLSSLYR